MTCSVNGFRVSLFHAALFLSALNGDRFFDTDLERDFDSLFADSDLSLDLLLL